MRRKFQGMFRSGAKCVLNNSFLSVFERALEKNTYIFNASEARYATFGGIIMLQWALRRGKARFNKYRERLAK